MGLRPRWSIVRNTATAFCSSHEMTKDRGGPRGPSPDGGAPGGRETESGAKEGGPGEGGRRGGGGAPGEVGHLALEGIGERQCHRGQGRGGGGRLFLQRAKPGGEQEPTYRHSSSLWNNNPPPANRVASGGDDDSTGQLARLCTAFDGGGLQVLPRGEMKQGKHNRGAAGPDPPTLHRAFDRERDQWAWVSPWYPPL